MQQFVEYSPDVRIFAMVGNFGKGTDKKICSVNEINKEVVESFCLGLSFYHAFTGCDSTTSFFDKSKKKFFEH